MLTREEFVALLARLNGEGDPLTADELAALVAACAEHAEDDELAAIEAACQGLGEDDTVPLAVVRAAVDLVDAVRAEADVRLGAAEEEAAERDALRARLAGEAEASDTPTEPEEGEEGEETEEVGDGEGTPAEPEEAATPPAEPEPAATPEQVPVAQAAAPTAPRPASTAVRRRVAGAVQAPTRRMHNRIVRDGGGEYADLREASQEMLRRRESMLSAMPGVSEQLAVASILAEYPDDRKIDLWNAQQTAETFARLVSDLNGVNNDRLEAVTAAGGFCAPVTPFYGIPSISTGDRPLRDSLISGQAVRGGISFRRPDDFTDFRTATGQWTRTNDITPGSDGPTTKRLLTVDCSDVTTEYLWAVTARLQFGNFMAMADPERVAEATEKTLHAHASLAEQLLLDKMQADSTEVDGGAVFGAWRDLLYHWAVTAAGYRSRRRMAPDAIIELRAPAWVRDMVREDVSRALNAYPEQAAMADSVVASALAVRNIRPYWYIDSPTVTGTAEDHSQVFGTQPTGAIVDFPESVQWQMSPPGTFLFIENGSLNFGPIRDSTLIGTNDYQTFAEDFEGLARIGYQSIWGNSIVCPNGASAGTSSPDTICTTGGEYIPTGSGIGAFTGP